MPVRASISRFRTRPYELGEMDPKEYQNVNASEFEKVLAEETIEDIIAEDLGQLRRRILALVEEIAPLPIIVMTPENNEEPTVKHSFLTGTEYRFTDTDYVLESILYRPKNPEAYQQNDDRKLGVGPTSPTEIEIAVLREKVMAFFRDESLKGLGFNTDHELNAFLNNLHSKRHTFVNENQFIDFVRKQFEMRISDFRDGDKGLQLRSPTSDLPLLLTNDMVILCRIIGKSREQVGINQQYYLKWHDISHPVFAINNRVEDRLAASFVYDKVLANGTS